jgi:hypothetical protein
MDQESYNTLQKADAALRRIDTALERLGDGMSRFTIPRELVTVGTYAYLLGRQRMSHAERGRLGAAARWGKAKRKK